MPKVGERIKEERVKGGWNQVQFAKLAKIAPSALSQIETGERHPSTGVLEKIATALSVSIDYLLGNKEEDELKDLLQNEKIAVMFRDFKGLTPKDRDFILRQIKFLKEQKEK